MRKIRSIFWISLSNFVFPCILVCALLGLSFAFDHVTNPILIIALSISDVNVEIIGVLFATIWGAHMHDSDDSRSAVDSKQASGSGTISISFMTMPPRERDELDTVEAEMDNRQRMSIPDPISTKATPSGVQAQQQVVRVRAMSRSL